MGGGAKDAPRTAGVSGPDAATTLTPSRERERERQREREREREREGGRERERDRQTEAVNVCDLISGRLAAGVDQKQARAGLRLLRMLPVFGACRVVHATRSLER